MNGSHDRKKEEPFPGYVSARDAEDAPPDMGKQSLDRQEGTLKINDTTGHVEIGIRDFTALMLRLDRMMDRLDEVLSRSASSSPEAVMSSSDSTMTLDEFLSFTQQWLDDKGKRCAVFRFAGKWSHVNNEGTVIGAWPGIDEAIDATNCDNDCSPRAFRLD